MAGEGQIIEHSVSGKASTAEVAGLRLKDSPLEFSLILGDITEAPVDAIMCPSDRMMGMIFTGGVSGAIERSAGQEPFTEAKTLLEAKTGGSQDSGLEYTASVAVGSGRLSKRGIKKIIMTNVFPKKGRFNMDGLTNCVISSAIEAASKGMKSLAIPALSTGTFGNLSYEESITAVLNGLKIYNEMRKSQAATPSLDKVALVLYFKPTHENVATVKEMLTGIVQPKLG